MKKIDTGRKAQVTVFIIIGIILLVSASIVIYITQLRKVEVIEEVVVPPEVQPVYDYVTGCLSQIGADALAMMGTQGGYSDLSPERIDTRDITMTPPAYIKIDPSNTFKLPHWFYEGEWRIPTIEFMQGEIADYVTQNLAACISSFEAFRPQYEITELGPPLVLSVITEDDVAVILEYPLEIRQAEKVTEHDRFIAMLPVRLRKIHELAEATLREVHETHIFENVTIDLMAMDPEVPMDPMGIEFSCGGKQWGLDEVEKKVQKLMYYNVPKFRVRGTDYPQFAAPESVYEALKEYTMEDINEGNLPTITTPSDAIEYNKMMIDPGIEGAEGMKVAFSYQYRWGMDLTALPNDGGILRSNVGPGQGVLRLFCITTYHFVYDVIYPVMARISDPDAFAGLGYVFQFAFPVLIDDNRPNREEFGVRNFQGYYIDTGFCEQAGGDVAEIRVIGVDEAGFRMTAGMSGVNISYRCIGRQCDLGQTGYDQNAPGRYALIRAMPPGCANPIIRAEKDGYLPIEGQLTEDYLELEMIKLRKMPFTVIKHTYSESSEGLVPGSEKPISKGDEVSLYLRLRNKPVEHDQYKMVQFGDNETGQIEIIEETAEYDIDLILQNYGTIVGGFKAENLTIKYSDFSGANEMVFHVFEYSPRPASDNEERQAKMMTLLMEMNYTEELKPTFR
jgi:hypothetical protein